MKRYWLYDRKSKWYLGKFVDADEKPSNGFEYEPIMDLVLPGTWPRFNGVGWVIIHDGRNQTLEQAQQEAHQQLNNAFYVPPGGYPKAEADTFDLQYNEAKAYIDSGTPSIILDKLAAAQGIDVDTLALKIIEKHDIAVADQIEYVATIQALRKRINDATQVSEVPTEQQIMEALIRPLAAIPEGE